MFEEPWFEPDLSDEDDSRSSSSPSNQLTLDDVWISELPDEEETDPFIKWLTLDREEPPEVSLNEDNREEAERLIEREKTLDFGSQNPFDYTEYAPSYAPLDFTELTSDLCFPEDFEIWAEPVRSYHVPEPPEKVDKAQQCSFEDFVQDFNSQEDRLPEQEVLTEDTLQEEAGRGALCYDIECSEVLEDVFEDQQSSNFEIETLPSPPSPLNTIEAILLDSRIWKRFHKTGNEMKSLMLGNYLIPHLGFKFTGLSKRTPYRIGVKLLPLSRVPIPKRMRKSKNSPETFMPKVSKEALSVTKTGKELMEVGLYMKELMIYHEHGIANRSNATPRFYVVPMVKYIPLVTLYEVQAFNEKKALLTDVKFNETTFRAVTCYSNKELHMMKSRVTIITNGTGGLKPKVGPSVTSALDKLLSFSPSPNFPSVFRNLETPVSVSLKNKKLWREFQELGNDMHVTRQGARIFPSLHYKITGLNWLASYKVGIKLVSESQTEASKEWFSNAKYGIDVLREGFDLKKLQIRKERVNKGKQVENVVQKTAEQLEKIPLVTLNLIYTPSLTLYELLESGETRVVIEDVSFEETKFRPVNSLSNRELALWKVKNNRFPDVSDKR